MHKLNIYIYIYINGNTEHNKGNKTVPGKVATTRTEDGYK